MSEIYWEELAGTLFEEAGDALFFFDPDSEQLQDVNPMAQRLSGFTRKELLELKITYLFRSEAEGGLNRLRQAFRRTGMFHSQEGFWLRHKDDHWVPVNLTITRLHTEPRTMGLITARDITERHQAQAQLQKAEAEFRRVLSSVSDCLWSAEVNSSGQWAYRYISPVVAKITGRPPEYYYPGPQMWLSTLYPEDRGRMEAVHALVRSGQSAEDEYRIIWPDGSVRWVRDSVVVTPAPDGRGYRLDGVRTDITERKQAEEVLRKTESQNRLLIEQMPAIVWTTDADLRITSSAGAGLATLSMQPNQLVGMSLVDYLQTEDMDSSALPIDASRRALQGEAVAYEMVWKGRSWQTHIEPLRDAEGQSVGVIGITLDVTDRQRAQEALRTSEAKYRTLIENLTQSIFLKDREYRYLAANKPFCLSVGLTEAQLFGKTDFDLYPAELAEKYRTADRLVLHQGKRLELEEQNLIQGKLRTVQKMKMPVFDDQGRITGVLGIFWDVTDQRNLEAQVRQAHKMEAIGQLAGGIAHDFNNLLTGILGNLSLALADLPEGHPCRELLDGAEVAGLRAADLIRQLLSFSRRAPLKPAPLDLNRSIDETVRLLRGTIDPRVTIQVRTAPSLWPVQADASQISQVLMNLCLNARDAMPAGGCLTLETVNIRLDSDRASVSIDGRPGEFVRLRVSDTGAGMSPEVQERIFEPFFTTKEPGKGTGLGLAMVFGIIKQHGGWIECTSALGQGTYFDVYLPRLVVSSSAPASQTPADGVRGGHETILLADDEDMVGRLGQTILERHGYRVFNVADGAEAVEVYRRQPNAIDLVILDLAMPKLSGPDALRELRKINPSVNVLISSGYCSDEDRRAIEAAGVLGFVAKPYRPADLARRVREALDQLRSSSGPAGV